MIMCRPDAVYGLEGIEHCRAAPSELTGMRNGEVPQNEILAGLPPADLVELQTHFEPVVLPTGTTLHLPDEPITAVYFPNSGVVSVVSTSRTGEHLEIAVIGREGFVGAAVLFDTRAPYWMVVQVESTGYRIPADVFTRAFNESQDVRRVSLAHVGRMIRQLARSAACNRFHSQQQRLARWLLVTMDMSGQRSLNLTHDFVAQMIGGPRHAVTAALNDLRQAGAIDGARGRIDIVDVERLVEQACECYSSAGQTRSSR